MMDHIREGCGRYSHARFTLLLLKRYIGYFSMEIWLIIIFLMVYKHSQLTTEVMEV